TYTNTALAAGVALTAEGKAEASMGVDAGDFDNDGDDDIVVTEQTGEGHNLYVNDGHGAFEDQSARYGVARLRHRRRARSADGQRGRADHPGAGTGARSVSAAPAQAAVSQSRKPF